MIHTAKAVRTLQAVAMLVGTALLLWSLGLPTFFRTAEAASITSASDTLSVSAPSVGSNHTITFTSPTGINASETIELTFNSNFDTSAILFTDVDITASGTDSTIVDGASGAGTWGFSTTTDVITLQAPTDFTAGSSTVFEIEIGTNATLGATGANQITNPSATSSYEIDIAGTMSDSGQVRVAIIDEVTVSASVDTSLTFTVSGVASGEPVNGTTTDITSTNTTIPFGTLPVDGIVTIAQRLTVATNAANGYTVTVEQDGPLETSTGETIDGFIDGSNTTTPTAWQSPSAQIGQLNTYGHWGVTSDDTAVAARTSQFASNTWVSGSTTPIAIMGHTGVSDGITAGIGSSTVGYQVEISALQEAGTDYSARLRYIATPTF